MLSVTFNQILSILTAKTSIKFLKKLINQLIQFSLSILIYDHRRILSIVLTVMKSLLSWLRSNIVDTWFCLLSTKAKKEPCDFLRQNHLQNRLTIFHSDLAWRSFRIQNFKLNWSSFTFFDELKFPVMPKLKTLTITAVLETNERLFVVGCSMSEQIVIRSDRISWLYSGKKKNFN